MPASRERALHSIYEVLAQALATPGLDGCYGEVLQGVLREAERSDLAGPAYSLLPLLACRAAGGDLLAAVPVAAAWRALQVAAKLLDDVEDGELPTDVPAYAAAPRVINVATGFIAAAGLSLARLAQADTTLYAVLQQDFASAMLEIAGGQHRDLATDAQDGMADALAIIAAKSGRSLALAARSGARCATGDEATLALFGEFGHNAGMLVQLSDDLTDLSQGDLTLGCHSLPIAYALNVCPTDDRSRLLTWLAEAGAGDVAAAERARALILASGAELYVAAEMARFRHRATGALRSIAGAGGIIEALQAWLAEAFDRNPMGV